MTQPSLFEPELAPQLGRRDNPIFGDTPKLALLQATLQVAVPLWIERFRGQPFHRLQWRAQECCDEIAFKGDRILFGDGKPGQTAEAFDRLAEGMACLAYAPGGVTAFGLHFEVVGSRTT